MSKEGLSWVSLVDPLSHPMVGKYHTLSNHLMHLERLGGQQ